VSDCYIGVAACGHIRMAVVDKPERVKDTAKAVSGAVRAGLQVKRVTTEEVRSGNWGTCAKCEPPKRKRRA
jgi:hypothetical protein